MPAHLRNRKNNNATMNNFYENGHQDDDESAVVLAKKKLFLLEQQHQDSCKRQQNNNHNNSTVIDKLNNNDHNHDNNNHTHFNDQNQQSDATQSDSETTFRDMETILDHYHHHQSDNMAKNSGREEYQQDHDDKQIPIFGNQSSIRNLLTDQFASSLLRLQTDLDGTNRRLNELEMKLSQLQLKCNKDSAAIDSMGVGKNKRRELMTTLFHLGWPVLVFIVIRSYDRSRASANL